MTHLLSTLLAFAAALAILVTIHELGHYLAARWVGVKVLRFSIGFGPSLISRHWGRDATEWSLAAIPLGGYVKMLDEREAPVPAEEADRAFNRQPVWGRILIVVAGPVANLLLAVLLYWVLFLHGITAIRPIVAEPAAATAAAVAGLHGGDEIRTIAGQPVHGWADLDWVLLQHTPSRDPLLVKLADGRSCQLETANVNLGDGKVDLAEQLGLRLFEPPVAARIGQLLPEGVAQRAGLQIGDQVMAVNGGAIAIWSDFVQVVRSHPAQPLLLTVQRGGQLLKLQLIPAPVQENQQTVGRIGAGPEVDPRILKSMFTEIHYSVPGAFRQAVLKTWQTAALNLVMMGRLITGGVSWHNLSGPLTIADYAGQSARSGWMTFVAFLAMVSVGLGVLNLLPIPLLDGGHLMYYIVEIVRGAPLSERMMVLGQRFGMAALLTLMIFAFYNDITRLFGS